MRTTFTRGEMLGAGALSLMGGSLGAAPVQSASPAPLKAKAKSVLFLFLHGGAPTQDMFDLKPDAPAEVRGEFKPIATSVPGIQHLRAPAADGQVDAQGRHRPLGGPQGRLPQHAAELHRLRASR